MAVGIVAILTGTTGELITLSVIGALALYMGSMAALLRLRRSEPDLERPFRAVAYPVFPMLALVLSCLCFVAVARSSPKLAAGFTGALLLALVLHRLVAKRGPQQG
jgi:ethanolamine permease